MFQELGQPAPAWPGCRAPVLTSSKWLRWDLGQQFQVTFLWLESLFQCFQLQGHPPATAGIQGLRYAFFQSPALVPRHWEASRPGVHSVTSAQLRACTALLHLGVLSSLLTSTGLLQIHKPTSQTCPSAREAEQGKEERYSHAPHSTACPQGTAQPRCIPQAQQRAAELPVLPSLPRAHVVSLDNYREKQGNSQF